MDKNSMILIENSFKVLKENPNSISALEILTKSAEDIFSYKFTINMIDAVHGSPIFFMSVYPDRSTIDKIVDAISKNESNMILKLWKQTKEWTIEIDKRILNTSIMDLSERELTAIFCHEIGHVSQSNSIPNRLITILQYEIAKASISSKSLIKDRFFQKILSLPIINACMGGSHDKSSIKEEIKADKFVKSMGYQNDLISVFKKYKSCKDISDEDKDMKKMTSFSLDALNQFKRRETAMLEYTINEMIKDCNSIYAESVLNEIKYDFFFENEDSSVTKEKRLNFLYERAEKLEEEFIATEFFGLGKRNLKKIDPTEIDYISIKIQDIKTSADKMMLVSYIHSKLDIVEYYIALYNNPKQARKYNIPYSIRELEDLRNHLKSLIAETINMKLPDKNNGLLVAWADGYEG